MGQGTISLWPVESKFIRCLSGIERRGIKIDQEFCHKMHETAQFEMLALQDELGFSPSRPTELGPFLLETLNLPVVKLTPGGKPSFDKEAMAEYDLLLETSDNQTAKQVLTFRGWQKADSACYFSYLNLVSPDGRVRPSFKIHGTITGRLSCEKPNLQQIPRKTDKPWNGKVKQCFLPENDEWELWEFDYKTLEFRLAACYANERILIEAINDGRDVHQVTADQIGIQRHDAKTLNFAILYGAGAVKISRMLKKPEDETNAILERFHSEFPGFRRVMRAASAKARKQSHVKYWSGRIKHYNTKWNREEDHKAFNALCQGGGAEMVKNAMVKIDPLTDENSRRMVLQVHDSVVWEIKKNRVEETVEQVKRIMSDWPQFSVKFDVDAHIWGQG